MGNVISLIATRFIEHEGTEIYSTSPIMFHYLVVMENLKQMITGNLTTIRSFPSNRASIIALLSFIALITISLLFFGWFTMIIDSSFATEILLEYRNVDKNISARVADERDILKLKQILSGHPFKDSPACGFSSDISITVTNDKKSIVFYPACDGCPLLRINDSDKYIRITEEARINLNEILGMYDMTFPCE